MSITLTAKQLETLSNAHTKLKELLTNLTNKDPYINDLKALDARLAPIITQARENGEGVPLSDDKEQALKQLAPEVVKLAGQANTLVTMAEFSDMRYPLTSIWANGASRLSTVAARTSGVLANLNDSIQSITGNSR